MRRVDLDFLYIRLAAQCVFVSLSKATPAGDFLVCTCSTRSDVCQLVSVSDFPLKDCVDDWLKRDRHCPVCKTDIVTGAQVKHSCGDLASDMNIGNQEGGRRSAVFSGCHAW